MLLQWNLGALVLGLLVDPRHRVIRLAQLGDPYFEVFAVVFIATGDQNLDPPTAPVVVLSCVQIKM